MEAAPASRSHWGYFVLWGFLFEVLLVLLIAPPRDGWPILIPFHNLALLSHIPFFWLADVFDGWFSVFLFIIPILFWAFLFHRISRAWARAKATPWVLRHKSWSKWGLVSLCVFSSALIVFSLRSAIATPFNGSAEISSMVKGNTAFALDLYQKLREHPGNLFFSPYSISTSLAMASAGAKGQTEREMTNALHFQLSTDKTHSALGELGRRMNGIERWNQIALKTANGLWTQSGHLINTKFLDVARNEYSAGVRQADFGRPESACDEINRWIEHQTKGAIKNALAPTEIDSTTELILCSAIYFKGKWKTQFNRGKTKPMPFHKTLAELVTVPMMYQKGKFKMAYNEERTVDMLELPYAGSDLSMVILLPSGFPTTGEVPESDLSRVEKELTSENLQAWLAKLDRAALEKIQVYLPRFATTQSFELSKELKRMGISAAFDANADFSAIDGTTKLFVSEVVHKAFVEVNESGTEAAAMTYVSGRAMGMDGRFLADHPFIFLIRENASGTILFLGRLLDPSH